MSADAGCWIWVDTPRVSTADVSRKVDLDPWRVPGERLSQKVLHSPPGSRLIPDTRKSTSLLLCCFIAAERPWIFFSSVFLSFFLSFSKLCQRILFSFFVCQSLMPGVWRPVFLYSLPLSLSLSLTLPLSLSPFLSFSFPLSLPLPSSLSRFPALPETCASVLLPSFLPSCLPSRSHSRVVFYASGRHRLSPVPMQRTTNSTASAARHSKQHPQLGLHRYCYPRGRLRSAAPPVLRLFPPNDSSAAWAQGLVDCSYVSNYLCLGPLLPTKEKRNFLSEPCPLHVLPVTREPACRLHTRHFQAPILNQFRLALPREEETAHWFTTGCHLYRSHV